MKLIPRDAVLAEIERRILILQKNPYKNHKTICHLDSLKQSYNALKVKEVDLDKELNDFIEEQKAWIKDDWVVEYNNGDSFNHIYDLENIAKHFFELGISVSNKAQKGE